MANLGSFIAPKAQPLITHDSDEDIPEDERANENPEDDVEESKYVVANGCCVIEYLQPMVKREELEEGDQRGEDRSADEILLK